MEQKQTGSGERGNQETDAERDQQEATKEGRRNKLMKSISTIDKFVYVF